MKRLCKVFSDLDSDFRAGLLMLVIGYLAATIYGWGWHDFRQGPSGPADSGWTFLANVVFVVWALVSGIVGLIGICVGGFFGLKFLGDKLEEWCDKK